MGADLHDADLGEANLRGASLLEATLFMADLSGAILQGARVERAGLDRAKFDGAVFGHTVVSSDLSASEGLENVVHRGPSAQLPEMLLRKALPVSFLRGGGVPDVLIDALDSLRAAVSGDRVIFRSAPVHSPP